MLNSDLQKIIEDGRKLASERRNEYTTLEHLLFHLLRNEEVKTIMKNLPEPVDHLAVFRDVRDHLLGLPQQNYQTTPETLSAVDRSLKRALNRRPGQSIGPVDLLFAIMEEPLSYSHYFLARAGFRASEESFRHSLDVLHKIQRAREDYHKDLGEQTNRPSNGGEAKASKGQEEKATQEQEEALFITNMNELAQKGAITPLIGRNEELWRVIQILHRKTKNNPIIVGPAGVGKTALVEGLAYAIHHRWPQIPDSMRDNVIYSINVTAMMSGTKFRGDLEQRIQRFVQRFSQDPKAIIFFDDIHGIISHSKSMDSTTDLSDMLKPAIDSGGLRIIGITNDKEFRRIFENKSGLARRFQRVDLAVPDQEEALRIVNGVYRNFEQFHQVKYSEEALLASVTLAQRYLTDRHLPDSAIDLLDEAGARRRLELLADGEKIIDRSHIEKLVAQQARLPYIKNDDRSTLLNLASDLKEVVFGQERAIDSLVSALKLSHAGLRAKEKPIGAFLFTGPTGVGKTELSKRLAEAMAMNLIRFDMSEYMEAHSVSKLIGTPPGYVGYEQEGLLCQKILKSPYAVLLLDEIEKAHPDVMNVLLQMMDNGIITDSSGREINCRNLIIILTSNVGATVSDRNYIGFSQDDRSSGDYDKAVRDYFSPEFRNRLDGIINFAPLSETLMLHIVDKFLGELRSQLQEKTIGLEIDEASRQWLARRGYDPKMGARPLGRLIEQQLKLPIAEMVLFEELRQAIIAVHLEDDELILRPRSASVLM